MWRWRVSSSFFSITPPRPSLLVWHAIVLFYFTRDVSYLFLILSFSLFLSLSFLFFSRFHRSPPRFFALLRKGKKRGRIGSHNNETEIVHRIYMPPPRAGRDTPRYSSRPNPRSRKRANDDGNILSLFNLTTHRRTRCIWMIFISISRAR